MMGAVIAQSELSPSDLEDRLYSVKEIRRYLPVGENLVYVACNDYIERIDAWRAANGFLVPADVLAPRPWEIPAERVGNGRMLVKGLLLRQKLCGEAAS